MNFKNFFCFLLITSIRSAATKINTIKVEGISKPIEKVVTQKSEPLLKTDMVIHMVAQSNYYPTDYSHAKNDPLKKKVLKALIKKNSFTALPIQGHIVTDFINVMGKKKIYFMKQEEKIEVEIVGYDKLTSLAVLKPVKSSGINIKTYKFIPRKSILGEYVKIISFDRFFSSIISKVYEKKESIMLDRSLPKDSYGAAVVSPKGDLLGMVRAKKLILDDQIMHDSVININILNDVVSQIVKYGRVIRGFTGLILDGKTIISSLQGSSASAVGLKEGMSIIKINNQTNVNNFQAELNKSKPGDMMNITAEAVNSEGQKISREVAFYVGEKLSILESITGHNVNVDTHVFSDANRKNSIYIQDVYNLPSELQEIIVNKTAHLPSKFQSYKTHATSGLFVLNVDKGNALFKKGDIIKSVNNHPASLDIIYSNFAMLKNNVSKIIVLTVIRNASVIKVEIEKKHIS